MIRAISLPWETGYARRVRYETRLALALVPLAIGTAPAAADVRGEIAALEIESHRMWQQGDFEGLGTLLDSDYRFVAMNGAVEARDHVLGAGGRPRAVEVRSLVVTPDEAVMHDDLAILLSTMEIDATVAGRLLPPRMRVLSVYRGDGDGWRLMARSITPILQPPSRDPPQ